MENISLNKVKFHLHSFKNGKKKENLKKKEKKKRQTRSFQQN
jgi:hypothetical protein